MNIRKNGGIILIILGIILSMDRTQEFSGIVELMVVYMQEYWPIILTLLGIYLLSTPKKKRR